MKTQDAAFLVLLIALGLVTILSPSWPVTVAFCALAALAGVRMMVEANDHQVLEQLGVVERSLAALGESMRGAREDIQILSNDASKLQARVVTVENRTRPRGT